MSTVADVTTNVLSTGELCRTLGMTEGRVDRWVNAGYLKPVIMGGKRKFSTTERDVAKIMMALVNAGISADAAHKAVRDHGWITDNICIVIGSRHKQRFWKSVATLPS